MAWRRSVKRCWPQTLSPVPYSFSGTVAARLSKSYVTTRADFGWSPEDSPKAGYAGGLQIKIRLSIPLRRINSRYFFTTAYPIRPALPPPGAHCPRLPIKPPLRAFLGGNSKAGRLVDFLSLPLLCSSASADTPRRSPHLIGTSPRHSLTDH